MRRAAGFLIAASLVGGDPLAQTPAPRNASEVFRAVVTDQLLPHAHLSGARVALVDVSLALCATPVVGPCVSEMTLQRVKLQAAQGAWPMSLADLLRAANRSTQPMPDLRSELVLENSRAAIIAAAKKDVLDIAAMSWPAFAGDQALVYVQYAQRSNWLVLVTLKDGAWHVTRVEAIAVS